MEGTPEQVFPQVEKLKELGLDTPQSTYLIYMLNKQGLNFDPAVLDDETCARLLIERLKPHKK